MMNLNRYRSSLLWIVCLAVLLVSGCSVPAYGEVVSPVEAPLLVTDTLEATHLPATATPTSTIAPTFTPTPAPMATATPLPTSTSTPTPTLEVGPAPGASAVMVSPLATPAPALTETLPPPPTATYPAPAGEIHVPILMYHYISELPADADRYRINLTVTPGRFEEQLQYLQSRGYESVTLEDLYLALAEGRPLPARPIVLTFDDGYEDAFTQALPILQRYGFRGEFFVLATPPHYEAPGYMTWEEIRLMAEAGMSMQAHGRDHYDMTGRSYDFLVYQILGAKEAVEAHAGRPVRFFCYPSGRYDEGAMAVVESSGYWGAVTTEWGTTQRLDNRYAWPRIRVQGTWSIADFARIIEQLER